MKILVTGGSGTLGGYVIRELLRAGHHVSDYSLSVPVIAGVSIILGDIMDLGRLREVCHGHDAIIHLAAVVGPAKVPPSQLMTINIIGTVNVLEAALAAGVGRVIFASSGAATGFTFPKTQLTPCYLPIDESHPCEPQDEYGLSKLLAEQVCRRYSAIYGLQTVCLRINNNWYVDREGASAVIGRGWAERFSSVEDLWTQRYRKSIEDPDGVWPVPGPPAPHNVLWAFTDARDAAQAFRLAAEDRRITHDVLSINGDETCSKIETRELVARYYAGVPLLKPLEGYASLWSHDKGTRLLGYQPRYRWRQSDFGEWLQRGGLGSAV